MNDRIKLAEAIGWRWYDPYWVSTGVPPHIAADVEKYAYFGWASETPPDPPFDPFESIEDDFEVLDWMRKQEPAIINPHKSMSSGTLTEADILMGATQWSYQVGNYARAALKVIDENL